MPRDDLTIDGFNRKNMPQIEHQDAVAVLEDFTNRTSNLPQEIAFMHEESAEKERQIQILLDAITQRDNAIQKFIKNNHSVVENPKEPGLRRFILDAYDKIDVLQDQKIALARKTQRVLDRHTRVLDEQILALQERSEFPTDVDIPSLLRPEGDVAAEKLKSLNRAALAESRSNAVHLNGQAAAAARILQQNGAVRSPAQLQAMQTHNSLSSPVAGSPAANLILQRQQREASAGTASIKRQRLTGGLGALPTNPSGLARHSSTGPGTPKAGTPTGERAGSAGPVRPHKSGVGKKTAPHQQKSGAARKKAGLPGKSSLNRVKTKSGLKNSPSSTNDSELSDAESGASVEDDEAITPPPGQKLRPQDEEMMDPDDDDATDDRKYCICQRISFGDMVACDNDNCPREWFHWPCVKVTSEPTGAWFCPECTIEMEKEKLKAKKGQKL